MIFIDQWIGMEWVHSFSQCALSVSPPLGGGDTLSAVVCFIHLGGSCTLSVKICTKTTFTWITNTVLRARCRYNFPSHLHLAYETNNIWFVGKCSQQPHFHAGPYKKKIEATQLSLSCGHVHTSVIICEKHVVPCTLWRLGRWLYMCNTSHMQSTSSEFV